jgi:hypothetical protein
MSHNIVLSGVRITDLSLLGKIVADLSKGQARLVQNVANFRTYVGQSTTCDHRIDMPGPHDIGLVRQPDGSYQLKYDPFRMSSVFRTEEVEYSSGMSSADYGAIAIGNLLMEYTLQEAEIAAGMRGLSTQRVPGKNGAISLEIIGS